ncbi:hypothetical protein M406DRAFT_261266 [Cryphonectria parasitica EP155]|uniref:Uncharacterized protein n=1 Tax=Cryphonectria parasitica (strain ATCC 38755 / EP155) TaxID=660469 RepID=A0A9P5CLV4_CRYP1|nr:uncharacterized protein M406DRAFT_261266 [Cryphonectria parasitica EP155]KAF3763714.1 hypothetical protein M406DRAFT_261266 [Cryphonectria parasitica EP155]
MLAKPLKKATAAEIRKFILKEIILIFGCSLKITVDKEPENKAEIAKIIRALGILLIQIFSYNPHAQEQVEADYLSLVNAFAKLANAQSWK